MAGPDCTLVLVDAAAFNDLVRRVPGLALEVMKVMARRLAPNPTSTAARLDDSNSERRVRGGRGAASPC